MKTKLILETALLISLFFSSITAFSQDTKTIKLLPPRIEGGKTLMKALSERKTQREFRNEGLPLQILSELLWAADGINRPGSGYRTAPSAMNMQEIDIYLAKEDGLFLFNPKANTISQVLNQDIRKLTGKQAFVKDAPINLIFVADFSKMSKLSFQDKDFYAATDTGYISENIYLYCASSGLATVVRGMVDKDALSKAMLLRSDQKIILTQTIGYPK